MGSRLTMAGRRLWDASTGQCLKSIEDEQNSPVSVEWCLHSRSLAERPLVLPRSFADFTPNGAYIIASSLSSSIRIWSYHTSKSFKTYTGHRNQKFCCPAVIVDPTMSAGEEATDAWVIAGSEIEDGKAGATGEVVIWGLQGRQVLQRLSEHKDTVVALAVSPGCMAWQWSQSDRVGAGSSDSAHAGERLARAGQGGADMGTCPRGRAAGEWSRTRVKPRTIHQKCTGRVFSRSHGTWLHHGQLSETQIDSTASLSSASVACRTSASERRSAWRTAEVR